MTEHEAETIFPWTLALHSLLVLIQWLPLQKLIVPQWEIYKPSLTSLLKTNKQWMKRNHWLRWPFQVWSLDTSDYTIPKRCSRGDAHSQSRGHFVARSTPRPRARADLQGQRRVPADPHDSSEEI